MFVLRVYDKYILLYVMISCLFMQNLRAAENPYKSEASTSTTQETVDLEIVTNFVRKQLHITNTPDPNSFNVAFSPDERYECSAQRKTILVPRKLVSDIAEEDTYSYYRAAGFIDHEKTHLEKKHHNQSALFSGGSACMISSALTIPKYTNHVKRLLVVSNLALFSYLGLQTLSRHQEREADKGTRPDPKILSVMAEHYRYRAALFPQDTSWRRLFESHPPYEERAAYFYAQAKKFG